MKIKLEQFPKPQKPCKIQTSKQAYVQTIAKIHFLSIKSRGIANEKGINKGSTEKIKPLNTINLICWIIIPFVIIGMLVLDGLKPYTFNAERIIVFGVGISVLLIPFFSEITVQNVSFKKENNSE